jgi:hypothetical protein
MDYTEIQNDKIKASLIKVETLQKEYKVTLQQYQEAVKNYITTLKTSTSNSNSTIKFAALKGRTWWGTGSLSEGAVNTKKECETMCANSSQCSGATFNPVKRYCWTRTGDTSITVGETDDYALIPKQKAALIVMKTLNDKLLSINKKIAVEFKNINPEVEQQMKDKDIKHQELNKSYQSLLEQKLEMEKQLQEYYSIEQENENQSLYANQQSTSMRFLILITAIVILITIKRMYGADTPPISFTIWFFIIIILIILTYSLSSPTGFFMWFILIIAIILMKTGNLPSL